MDGLRLQKYRVVAILVILLTGVVLVFVGGEINPGATEPGGLLVSIGSEIFVAAVILLMVKALLIDSHQEITEKLEKISSPLNVLFGTQKNLRSKENVEMLLESSSDLLIGGVALHGSVHRNRHLFEKALAKKIKIRFLLLDPDSPDIVQIAKGVKGEIDSIKSSIRATLNDIEYLQKKAANQKAEIQVRLLTHEPAYSFLLKEPSGRDGMIQIGLRSFGLTAEARPEWRLSYREQFFDPLVSSCEELWRISKPYPKQKAGLVVYRQSANSGIEVLLITSRDRPGSWIFPMGHVDDGESLQKTAVRECLEESGYEASIEGIPLGEFRIPNRGAGSPCTFFLGEVIGEHQTSKPERQIKWVSLSEVTTILAEVFRPIAKAAIFRLDEEDINKRPIKTGNNQ